MKYILFLLALLILAGCAQEEQKSACTKEYRPVCGTDNQTYANSCLAEQAGVAIAAEGACVRVNESARVYCTMEYNPVCGQDGKTYDNACVATQQNGVQVAYEGECAKSDTVYTIQIVQRSIDIPDLVVPIEKEITLTIMNKNDRDILFALPQMGIRKRIAGNQTVTIAVPALRKGVYGIYLNEAQVGTIQAKNTP